MSKINAIRIVNLNYNNNAIRIDDETFHLSGESTLLSLRNGGGKSVLVQVISSLFVRKRYRDTKDRLFKNYFTTNKPTYVLVEWSLDGGEGYVLTGMMVRKAQTGKGEEDTDDLEMVNFIHEYNRTGPYSIKNLPVVEEAEGSRKLKGFYAFKQLMEGLKKNHEVDFNCYDMNISGQSRQYFEKLEEYRIYHKEWESIIKKVNLKESGLSELFTDAKDESGLIEKWFLDAVENKLNKEDNKIREFEKILMKYIYQYRENKSKIERTKWITKFKQDTKVIYERAEELENSILFQREKENEIANLLVKLKKIQEQTELESVNIEALIVGLEHDLKEIAYEETSYEIYGKDTEKEQTRKHAAQLSEQIDKSETEKEQIRRHRLVLECAKLNTEYKKAEQALYEAEHKLELFKQKDKDLAPERENLGYTLKCCYEEKKQEQKTYLKLLESKLAECQNYIAEEKSNIGKLEKEIEAAYQKIGETKGRIFGYDAVEDNFNRRCKENLARTIVGTYEEGILQEKEQQYQEAGIFIETVITKNKLELTSTEEMLYTMQRNLEDLQEKTGVLSQNIKALEEQFVKEEEQIEERKQILCYIEWKEEDFWNTGLLAEHFDKKIREIRLETENLSWKIEEKNREYRQIEEGCLLELPKELEEKLQKSGIIYVYGMEWLKQYPAGDKKEALVENNPFLPYSLIMSKAELERLEKEELGIFTALPIPIVVREELEHTIDSDYKNGILRSGGIRFYIYFNKDLLEEEGRRKLLEKKQAEQKILIEQREKRNGELEFFQTKKSQLLLQDIEEQTHMALEQEIERKQKELETQETKKYKIREDMSQKTETVQKLREEIQNGKENLQLAKQKIQEFVLLKESYKQYIQDKETYAALEKKAGSLQKVLSDKREALEQTENDIQEGKDARRVSETKLEKIEERLAGYNIYKTGNKLEITKENTIESMEARYEAISGSLSGEQKQFEDLVKKEKDNTEYRKQELEYKVNHYQIGKEEYETVVYDRFLDEEYEKEIVQKENEIKTLREKYNKENEKLTLISRDLEQAYQKLHLELGKQDLKPKNMITDIQFAKRKKAKLNEKEKAEKKLTEKKQRILIYKNNISNLAEYEELELKEIRAVTFDVIKASEEELNQYRGRLLRDYRESDKNTVMSKQKLAEEIQKIMNLEEYKDPFFSQPLDTICAVREKPEEIKQQLSTLIASYDTLVEKLAVDIALLEKEQKKVLEIFMDYIKEVHDNLDKIDKNSNIKVRNQNIKMLRIKLPKWEEQKVQYEQRLEEMMDELTESSLRYLEKNEPIEDFIGAQITTKNLYNTVVGISNIEIRLYKIEEQREYPISWAEVAKNSGGEGFLSAFVILSSLLSFMRRDDTDIFKEYEEGKVLIMDNPFAQTNASHLLKPLMDIAKKSNTQLICLSGLGGESIYNRFDNIYVLSLAASGLNRERQYLKSEHMKGEEPEETMEPKVQKVVASQMRIEDMAQIELLF